jgi:hypothetical protein
LLPDESENFATTESTKTERHGASRQRCYPLKHSKQPWVNLHASFLIYHYTHRSLV